MAAASRDRFLSQYPEAKVYDNHRRLLADPKVDAVVVAVPTGYHQAAASDALKAHIPVLLEKPMARTAAQCRRLIEDSEKYRTLLMVAHCRRYDPNWGMMAKQIASGRLGSPVLWRSVSAGLGPGRWFMDDRLGGGPLLDGAVHNYDFANLMFGDPDSVVSSSIKLNPGVTAVDTGCAVVRYRSGHQLLMSWSWATRGCALGDVIGPKGYLQFDTGDLTPPRQEAKQFDYCCITDLKGKQRLVKAPKEPTMFVRQARHFLECVRGRAECQTPGTEAIKAVAVGEAVLKAGPEGKSRKVTW